MSKRKHTEAEIIGVLKQLEAGRTAEDAGRELGVSKHTDVRNGPKHVGQTHNR